MQLLMQVGLVALGSAVGGVTRWGVGWAAARFLGAAFPFGTLLINVSGSFFLGWFLTVLGERSDGRLFGLGADGLRLAVAVGFTGAFTTFSTFEWESHELLRDGDGLAATVYMFGSLLLGLAAVRLGMLLARYV